MLIDILAPDLARRGIVMHSPFYAAGNDKISAQQLTATYARLCTNWILWFLSSDTDARNYFVSCRRAGTINRAILSFSHLLCKSTEKVLGTQTKSHSFFLLDIRRTKYRQKSRSSCDEMSRIQSKPEDSPQDASKNSSNA